MHCPNCETSMTTVHEYHRCDRCGYVPHQGAD